MNGGRTPRRAPRGGPETAADETTLSVRVQPRASKNELAGMSEGVVKVRLTAPPLDNRANEALVDVLASAAGVPRRMVEIVAGERGRNKIVRVRGISPGELFRRLGV